MNEQQPGATAHSDAQELRQTVLDLAQRAGFVLCSDPLDEGEKKRLEAFYHHVAAHLLQATGSWVVNDAIMADVRAEAAASAERLFNAACEALGEVDDALGMPQDGCNSPQATLQRIALVKQFMSADSAAELRRAVRAMAAMLDNGEWAEHVSTDRDAQDLESAITDLVGDHSAMHDALRQIASGDAQDARALAQQTLAELATDALEAESSLAVVERPGCIPVAELRRYFEASVAQTPPLALRFPLTPVAESVFGRYVDGATNTLWLGFSIGMRCAERVAAAQQPAGTTGEQHG